MRIHALLRVLAAATFVGASLVVGLPTALAGDEVDEFYEAAEAEVRSKMTLLDKARPGPFDYDFGQDEPGFELKDARFQWTVKDARFEWGFKDLSYRDIEIPSLPPKP